MVNLGFQIVQGTIQIADLSLCSKVDYLTDLRANLSRQGEHNGYLPKA